jgi:hypothetical protein
MTDGALVFARVSIKDDRKTPHLILASSPQRDDVGA